MRIQTAADPLLPALDIAVGQTDSADKQSFARLLQAQPQNGQATPDAHSQLHDVAKNAQTVLPSGEVNADAAKSKTKPDLAKTTAPTPAATSAAVATAASTSTSSTPTPVTPEPTPATVATDATGKAAEFSNTAPDLQLESADETSGKAVTTPAKADSGNTKVTLAQQELASARSPQTAATATPKNPATAAARPTLIPNPVLSPPLQKEAVDPASVTGAGQKPPAGPADKPVQKSRSTRDAPAPAAVTTNADAQVTAAAAPDINAAIASLNQPVVKDDAARATDSSSTTTAVLNSSQAAVTAAANPTTTMPYPPADTSLPASRTVSISDAVAMRGTKLPQSGKSLPSATDADAATSQSPLLHAFKEFADLASSQNPAPAADTAALQASQNLLNAAAGNAPSQESGAAQQATNAAGTSLSAQSAGTATLTSSSVNPAQAPLTFASGLAMTSSGWGEETVQHIRWLKDHDQQSAEIQLHPAELGRLSISIDIKNGQASVQLMAGNAEARDLLEKSLPDLRNLLAQSGMSMTDSGVAQHSGGQQAWPNRFSSSWFAADDLKPLELTTGKPALFRSAGGSHRIDQYV